MEAPVLVLPSDIVIGNDQGRCSAVVLYDVLFSDNCIDVNLMQESGWPSGYEFPLGTTTNIFVVTDASGNSATGSFTITVFDNEAPSIASVIKSDFNGYNVSCFGSCNGSAFVSAMDNCSNFISFLWSNGQTDAMATNLCAGTYTVTVTDGNNSVSTEVSIIEPVLLTVEAGDDAITYYGYEPAQTATRTAEATGGVGPYTYSWTMNRPLMCNMVTGEGDEAFSSESYAANACPESPLNYVMESLPVCSGNSIMAMLMEDAMIYVTVTDANGCTATDSFLVDATDVRCFAGNSGTAKVQVCHRTGSIKNPWITLCIDPDAVANHLAHGDYLGECVSARMSTEQESTGIASSELKVYPNPNNGNFTLDFHSGTHSIQDMVVELKNVAGNMVYSKTISTADGHFKGMLSSEDLQPGFYLLHIQQGNESLNQSIIIMK
jgi:hypothetical protein